MKSAFIRLPRIHDAGGGGPLPRHNASKGRLDRSETTMKRGFYQPPLSVFHRKKNNELKPV
jgi:hypothetical protein